MNTSIKHSPFIKNKTPSTHFFIPSYPFSIWEGDTLLWASDERHARRLTSEMRKNMTNEFFVMNGKTYTILGGEDKYLHTQYLRRMIQTSVSGEKNQNEMPFLSIYYLCREFFTTELTTRFEFSEENFQSRISLERGVPFMFALLLIIYPLLCKDPTTNFDIHFESYYDCSAATITPHCDFDLEKDIFDGDFIGTLLRETVRNSEFSLTEEKNGEFKSLVLSSPHVYRYQSTVTLNANTLSDSQFIFTVFLSLCAKYEDSAQ